MGALLSAVRFLVLLWLFLSRPHRSHALLGSEEFHPLCKQPSVGQALMGNPVCARHGSFSPSVPPHESSAANLKLPLLSAAGPPRSASPLGRESRDVSGSPHALSSLGGFCPSLSSSARQCAPWPFSSGVRMFTAGGKGQHRLPLAEA